MDAIQKTDLLIIGSGLSGMSAAVFAANRNINAVVTGGAGGFEYSSGLMDLWGASLTKQYEITKKPWTMLEKLRDQDPAHPLVRIKKETIQQAFLEITTALKHQGLTYSGYEEKNTLVVVVPDDQLSLAIGRQGQNVRLAAALLGWRIDVKSEQKYAKISEEGFQSLLDLPGMDEKIAEALYDGGFNSAQELAQAEVATVVAELPALDENRVARFIAAAKKQGDSEPKSGEAGAK